MLSMNRLAITSGASSPRDSNRARKAAAFSATKNIVVITFANAVEDWDEDDKDATEELLEDLIDMLEDGA
jgi:hypothetical protein